MIKENKPTDIIEQYIEEKNVEKLREILELSKKKVEELQQAVAKVEEEKLLEAFRTGDKEYISKVANEMGSENKEQEEIEEIPRPKIQDPTSELPDTYVKY